MSFKVVFLITKQIFFDLNHFEFCESRSTVIVFARLRIVLLDKSTNIIN